MTALTPVGANLWVAPRPLKLIIGDIGTRMTVIRLADGGLFLHSPVPLDDETRAALDGLGPVRAVVAPNLHHHFYVNAYAEAYPSAKVFGPPGLARKKPKLRLTAELGDEAPEAWHEQIDQHLFRGAKPLSEFLFLHRESRSLLLTDLAFNVPHEKTHGARFFYWMVGAAGHFGPHAIARLGIRDRKAARTSVETILGWDFERIIVTHGDILETGAKQRFAEGFAYLLR